MITAENFLANLAKIIAGRSALYGATEDSLTHIAHLWHSYIQNRFGRTAGLDTRDVIAMLLLMKVTRCTYSPSWLDSWLDIAGYAACGAETNCSNLPENRNEDVKQKGEKDLVKPPLPG